MDTLHPLIRLVTAVTNLPGAGDDPNLALDVYDAGPGGPVVVWTHEDLGESGLFGAGRASEEDLADLVRFCERVEAEEADLVYAASFYSALGVALLPFRLPAARQAA